MITDASVLVLDAVFGLDGFRVLAATDASGELELYDRVPASSANLPH